MTRQRPVRRHAPYALLAALGSSILISACGGLGQSSNDDGGGGDGDGGQIVLSTTDMPQTLNPAVTHVSTTVYLSQLAFDGLVRPDAEFQATPALAESWEISDDGLEYTFHLRPDVTFHDGGALTSSDVKFTWEVILHPDNATAAVLTPLFLAIEGAEAYHKGEADEITGITLPDEQTVHVTLAHPYAPFLTQSAFQSIISEQAYGDVPPGELGSNPETSRGAVGTGPFKVEEWVGNERIVYRANEDYWDGAPKIDTLILKDVADQAAIASQLRTGEIDVTGMFNTIPVEEYEAFNNDENFTVLPLTSEWPRMLEPQVDDPIMADPTVRKALFHAIDRQEILDELYLGHGKIVDAGWIHPNNWAYHEPSTTYDYDPELAKKLLDEAGWVVGPDGIRQRDGERLSFQLLTQNNFADDFPILVQQYWREIGVEATMDIQDFTTLQPLLNTRKFQMNANWYPSGLYADPDYALARYTCALTRSFCSESIDKLKAEAAATMDQAKRKALYAQITDELQDAASMGWVILPDDLWVSNSSTHLADADTVLLQFVNAHDWSRS